jgi:hypothetical protein
MQSGIRTSIVGIGSLKNRLLWVVAIGILFVGRVQAQPTLQVETDVNNPPEPFPITNAVPQQVAIGDTATLVPVATFGPILQKVLNAQGFTNANNWTLNTNTVTLANNAVFTLDDYYLFPNAGVTAVGEEVDFTLSPNPGAPAAPAGSTVTEHWLQYVNTNAQVNGYGFQIAGMSGYWQMDNGQVNGGAAAGAGTGPYYDSNADAGFSTPPSFHDAPQFYSGIGTYLHFDAIPTWDIYTPGADGSPATEQIDVANYGLAWGFSIVPEPATMGIFAGIALVALAKRRRSERKAA